MYRFHAAIHAAPVEPTEARSLQIAGRSLEALDLSPARLDVPLPVTFEEALERLEPLPRMYAEPDGSFVWVSERDEPAWQVDGLLVDQGGRLAYVELRGACSVESFDRLLACFGWPASPVVFQLLREALFLDEAAFRRWAAES